MPPDAAPIPVTVLTGFLGAGKSTLLECWLAGMTDNVAVIVNELGEVGLDGDRLSARVARLREIAGACICCQGAPALARAFSELAAMKPDRILVETSGAASPAGVVSALRRIDAPLRLDGVITVVDGSRLARVFRFDLAKEQLAFADVVVVSHTDIAAPSSEDQQALEALAPAALIVDAAKGRVGQATSLAELLDRRPRVPRILPRARPHSPIDAVSLTHDGELDEDAFGGFMEDVLGAMGPRILRLKGVVAIEGVPGRLVLSGVGDGVEVEFEDDADRRETRLVVLGLSLDERVLRDGFQACVSSSAR
ncbi:MAG: GTP-binding protein [Sandaracinaceae bacterium]